jgi:hypothetical protein
MFCRELTQADIEYLKVHSISRGIFNVVPEETQWNYALVDGDTTLLVGGISLINATTAWCWIDMADTSLAKICTTLRVMIDYQYMLCAEHKIRKLICYVEDDFAEAQRLVEHLGYKFQFTMPNFVGDKPARIYSLDFEVK